MLMNIIAWGPQVNNSMLSPNKAQWCISPIYRMLWLRETLFDVVIRCRPAARLCLLHLEKVMKRQWGSRRDTNLMAVRLTGDTRKIFVSRPRRRVSLGARLDRL